MVLLILLSLILNHFPTFATGGWGELHEAVVREFRWRDLFLQVNSFSKIFMRLSWLSLIFEVAGVMKKVAKEKRLYCNCQQFLLVYESSQGPGLLLIAEENSLPPLIIYSPEMC